MFKPITINEISDELYATIHYKEDPIVEGDWFIVKLFDIENDDYNGEGEFHLERCKSIDDVWINNERKDTTRHIENCEKVIATTNKRLFTCQCGKDNHKMSCKRRDIPVSKIPQKIIDKFRDNKTQHRVEHGIAYKAEYIQLSEFLSMLKINMDNTINIKKIK